MTTLTTVRLTLLVSQTVVIAYASRDGRAIDWFVVACSVGIVAFTLWALLGDS